MADPTSSPPGGNVDDPLVQAHGRVPNWFRSSDDMGQYLVLVMRVKQKLNDTAGTSDVQTETTLPNSFIIGKAVELVIGLKEARAIQAIREGRGARCLLRTSSLSTYQKLQRIVRLPDGTNVEVFPHATLNTIQGIAYHPDTIDVDEETTLDYLSSQGVKHVRRIKKRIGKDFRNTPLTILTFHGTVLPEYVYFGLMRVEIRKYYPNPMVCFNCGNFTHTKKHCTQDKICLNCSAAHDMVEGMACPNTPYCKNCRGNHPCVSKDCPVYAEEEKIIKLRIDKGITFGEARKQIKEQKTQTTYSSCVQQRMSAEESGKDEIIQALRSELQTVRSEFNQLKELYKKSISQLQTHQQQCSQQQEAHPQQKKITPELKKPSPSSQSAQSSNVPATQTTHVARKDHSSKSPPKDKRTKNAQSNKIIEQPKDTIWAGRIRSRSNKRSNQASPSETDLNLRSAKTFVAQASDSDDGSQMQS